MSEHQIKPYFLKPQLSEDEDLVSGMNGSVSAITAAVIYLLIHSLINNDTFIL